MADGFLSRWSQRKLDERAGKPLAEPELPAAAASTSSSYSSSAPGAAPAPIPPLSPSGEGSRLGNLATTGLSEPATGAGSHLTPTADAGSPELPPALPTLADTLDLTPSSDFKPFMARGVSAEVKNAAMKKLFTDPHFNVMDRLDTYIDDYSLPDPIPEAMLRKMVSAKFLGLFDENEKAGENVTDAVEPTVALERALPPSATPVAASRDDPDTAHPEVMAQSAPTLESSDKHDDPDMRLQPDHAPASQVAGRGAA